MLPVVMGGGLDYGNLVLDTAPDNLIAYWPLNEVSGLVANDISGNENHAAYTETGVTLNQLGPDSSSRSILLDPANGGYVNLYSLAFRADFNGDEGALMVWVKMRDVSVWEDGTARTIIRFYTDASHQILVSKTTTSTTLIFNLETPTGDNIRSYPAESYAGWMCIGLSWSAAGGYMRAYVNGAKQGADMPWGDWTGLPTSGATILGAGSITPTTPWDGYISNSAVWNAPLSDAQHKALARASLVSPTVYSDGFTVCYMPDTQYLVQLTSREWIMDQQCQWLADNMAAYNILAVLHEGDVVETVGTAAEWTAADEAIDLLDAGSVPYLIVCGGHDYDDKTTRDATTFNATFPQARYTGQAWWNGGFYEASHSENNWMVITHDSVDYLLVSLVEEPPAAVLTWLDALLTTHADKDAILVTHAYLDTDNTLHAWGEGIWGVIKTHDNVIWVGSGHVITDGVGYLESESDNGRAIHQKLSNYQVEGNGNLVLVTFRPSANTIDVQTYSPNKQKLATGAEETFSVTYPADLPA